MAKVAFQKGNNIDVNPIWQASKLPIIIYAVIIAIASLIVVVSADTNGEIAIELAAAIGIINIIAGIAVALYVPWNGVKRHGWSYEKASIAAILIAFVAGAVAFIMGLFALIYFQTTSQVLGLVVDSIGIIYKDGIFNIVLACICTYVAKRVK